jgi:16S rRNA U516 pseudouridylate synthase RsuA-like enzyme
MMLLRDYLQKHHWISRRKITDYINQWVVFINNKKVESYKAEIQENDLLKISPLQINEKISFNETKEFPEILIFNKPIWYTCSKSDPHNKTFYELLPREFVKKYYYIW